MYNILIYSYRPSNLVEPSTAVNKFYVLLDHTYDDEFSSGVEGLLISRYLRECLGRQWLSHIRIYFEVYPISEIDEVLRFYEQHGYERRYLSDSVSNLPN